MGSRAQQLPHRVVGVGGAVRIAGAVREDQPEGVESHDLGRGRLRRHHDDLRPGQLELVDDGVLDAEIDHHNSGVVLEGGASVGQWGGDFRGHVATVDVLVRSGVGHQGGLGLRIGVSVADHALDHASAAQAPGEGPRVDALDPHDPVLLHEALEVLIRAVVAGRAAELPNDEAFGVGPIRFHVVDRHAVVADVGVRHRHDLTVVARIGKDLLVAGHGGVEDHLADGASGIPEGVAAVHGAVLQGQNRAWFVEHRHCRPVL